jgi:hypothetical protein
MIGKIINLIIRFIKFLRAQIAKGSVFALQNSGVGTLYLGTSTLLAAALLGAYLTYAWDITPEKYYKALAMLRGDDITEMQEAAADRIREMSYDEVREWRAKRMLEEEYRQESTRQIASFVLPPEEPKPVPPPPPSEASRISAYEKRVKADLAKTQSEGLDEQTRLLENMEPEQAKEVIRKLWKEDPNRVLTMLLAMPDKRRGEILYTLQQDNAEELKDLCEILQRIGDGEPKASIIKGAAKEP